MLSVVVTPSTWYATLPDPFEMKSGPPAMPLWLPATLTVSIWTPGTCWMSDQMSRDVGICVSSSCEKFSPVSTLRVSMSGVALVTVTVSWTFESFSWTSTCVFLPTETETFSRVTVVKPGIVTVTEYIPGGTLRKRNRPLASTLVVIGRDGPVSVAVPPGMTPPCSSSTLP